MPESVRIVLEYHGASRKLFRVTAGHDGSLYIFPYGPAGRYYCGEQASDEHEDEITFPFDGDPPVERIPKISIHPSGQVHVKAPDYVAGPVHIPRFQDLRGHHVATVSADALGSLAEFTGTPRDDDTHLDHIRRVREGVDSARVAVYVNGRERDFPDAVRLIWPIETPSGRVEVGLAFLAQEPLGERGVSVIAGWNPLAQPNDEDRLLFVRCE